MAGTNRVATHPPQILPLRGERITRTRAGVTVVGTVHYADELQVLVKWDDGHSSSLRVGKDRFKIVDAQARVAINRRAADADAPLSREKEAEPTSARDRQQPTSNDRTRV